MKAKVRWIASFVVAMMLLLGVMLPISTKQTATIQPIQAEANDAGFVTAKGEIKGNGVYGYTTDYVCNGGSKEIEHAVENGWHITAKNETYSYGIFWYQCWDSDDGDYYGWIDGNYISFYTNSSSGSFTATIYSVDNRKGEVAGSGVCSYTTNYVAYGGPKTVVRSSNNLKSGWHITAKNKCSSYGITWYECWDTDDGDYYGWIDSNYLTFYSTATAAPVQTSVVVKTVTVTVTQPAKVVTVTQPAQTVIQTVLVTEAATVSDVDSRNGEISGSGVCSYTTNYVAKGGPKNTVRSGDRLTNGLHITAKKTCSSHGTTWYECWDTDNGDYYGWIDANNLTFYATTTEAPAVTAAEEETILTTETVAPASAAGGIFDFGDNNIDRSSSSSTNSGMDNNLLLILIAVAIFLIIIVAVLIILLMARKMQGSRSIGRVQENFDAPQQPQHPSQLFCTNCGASRTSQDGIFCKKCGHRYEN